jgi:hypothetical protein
MKMQPVESSNIEAMGHDPLTSEMDVKFKSSALPYRYANVSEEVYQRIITAPSVGSAFIELVRNHPELYPFTKLEPEVAEPAATPKQAGQRITSLTVGRTYNLGNYESLRIELSWDLAPSESPAQIYRALRSQLDQLRAMRLQAAVAGDDDPDRPF